MERNRRTHRTAAEVERRPIQYGRPAAGVPRPADHSQQLSAVNQQIGPHPTVAAADVGAPKTLEFNLHLPKLRHKKVLTVVSRLTKASQRLLLRLGSYWRHFRTTKIGLKLDDIRVRVSFVGLAFLIAISTIMPLIQSRLTAKAYAFGDSASLLTPTSAAMAAKLTLDSQAQTYKFNTDYTPPVGSASSAGADQAIASVSQDLQKGMTVTDPLHGASVTVTPKFAAWQGKQDSNRIVFPLTDGSGWMVYSVHAVGVKEDILLSHATGDTKTFDYKLGLGDSLAARIGSDGSLGIYGNTLLTGNVTASNDKDSALLQKARQNSTKDTLLFTIPAPTIQQQGKAKSPVKASYSLQGDTLRLTVSNLEAGTYPLDIDPSVYVTTASQFMRGNNESNIAFDAANDLILKGKTTGARINSWTAATAMNTSAWGQGTTVMGGYIYSVGGIQGGGTRSTYYSAGSNNFVVPTGVTSVTIRAWGAGGGGGRGDGTAGYAGGGGGGGGFARATITTTPAETLTVLVGTGGTAASANSRGGNGGGYSAVQRTGTFLVQAGGGGGGGGTRGTANAGDGGAGGGTNGSIGVNGDVGGGAGGGATGATGGTAGAAGPDANSKAGQVGAANAGGNGATTTSCTTASSGTGGAGGTGAGGSGGTAATCSNGGGGGGGRAGGGGGGNDNATNAGGGGGGGGSDLVTGSNTEEIAGSGTSAGNSSDPLNNGAGVGGNGDKSAPTAGAAGGVIISYTTNGGAAISNTVSWAHFNTTTNAIESPDPGTGTCSGWCTSTGYNLPASLTDISIVAYNGFLYVMGGSNSSGTAQTSVYIAKIGANGEPQLWHPTGGTPGYWYTDTALATSRTQFSAVASNNHMYILGGLTGGSPIANTVLSSNTVQMASITPTGTLSAFSSTGMQALPTAVYGLSAQIYNNVMYEIGGLSSFNGTASTAVSYSPLNNDGTMNSWQTANSLSVGRIGGGGNFSAIWGGYIYVAGGCQTVASGFCTATNTDVELASINADGSLDTWNAIIGLDNMYIGQTVTAWQNGLYRVGGCGTELTTAKTCVDPIADASYGVVNQDGDASTVATSSPSGSSPCSGGSPTNCDIPGTTIIGQALNATAVVNGFLYVMGGCTAIDCGTMSPDVVYSAISPNGSLAKPTTCTSGTYSGTWCIDSTDLVGNIFYQTGTASQSGFTVTGTGTTFAAGTVLVGKLIVFNSGAQARITARNSNTSLTVDVSQTVTPAQSYKIYDGVGAAAVAIFNSKIYLMGGLNGTANTNTVFYTTVNNNGTIGAWTSQPMASGTGNLAINSVSYDYAYARANPASAGTGNMYMFGGCSTSSAAGCTAYSQAVYKCTIGTTGALSACSTGSQLQIGTITGATGTGLGIMSGTVYANYIYLIGGVAPSLTDLTTVRYAKFDNNNNIVTVGTGWTESPVHMSVGRRRASAFGYNGYIYVVGGYDGTGGGGVLADIEFAKVSVSDGSLVDQTTGGTNRFNVSSVHIGARWGLSVPVSNSYAYVIGGCNTGASPACGSMTPTVQTFQVYNNDSGGASAYAATGSCASTAVKGPCGINGTDRLGAAATILNGYMYLAGGCYDMTCTTPNITTNVSYAPVNANGSIGAWTLSSHALPAARTFGKLVGISGSLYYVGGQSLAANTSAQSEVWYTTGFSAGDPTWNPTKATCGITSTGCVGNPRDQFGIAVWNNRIYVIGGYNPSGVLQKKVYISPPITGGDIATSWNDQSTAMPIAKAGIMATAYANNFYVFGGNDGTNYFNDSEYASISNTTSTSDTITQSGTAITGSGTNFNNGQVGSTLVYPDGTTAVIQTVTSTTAMTVNVGKTISTGVSYVIKDGTISNWTYTTSLPTNVSDGDAFAANGYMYLIGGRSAATTCNPVTMVAPISANTAIVPGGGGNQPTGIGEWYQTNANYTTGRYGAAATYYKGRAYIMDGGCNGSFVPAADRNYSTTVLSQPQVANYSLMIDTDTDVFPSKWLLNGIDNGVGASWQLSYQSMTNTTTSCAVYSTGTFQQSGTTTVTGTGTNWTSSFVGGTIRYPDATTATISSVNVGAQTMVVSATKTFSAGSLYGITLPAMTTWGQTTNVGNVTLGTPGTYTVKYGDGNSLSCARFFYINVSIDASQTFGYPEDITRGPTIDDLTLQFTSDPSKRLMHGRTFIGGTQQPDDTPF